jgi:hypothetical protein
MITSQQIVDYLKEHTGDNNWYVDTKRIGTPVNHRNFPPLSVRHHVVEAVKAIAEKVKEDKEDAPFEGGHKVATRKDQYGNVIKNVARHLARGAMRDQEAKKPKNEEVEQIEELKKATLRSYAAKRGNQPDAGGKGAEVALALTKAAGKPPFPGMKKAKVYATKEEVEQVDEGTPEFNARALRYAKADAAEKDREGRYSKKYPGGKEQHAKDTAAFMKRFPAPKNEEAEQLEAVQKAPQYPVQEADSDLPFEGPYKKSGPHKDKFGNPVKNVARHLAKKGLATALRAVAKKKGK